jgi:hypothetical protein
MKEEESVLGSAISRSWQDVQLLTPDVDSYDKVKKYNKLALFPLWKSCENEEAFAFFISEVYQKTQRYLMYRIALLCKGQDKELEIYLRELLDIEVHLSLMYLPFLPEDKRSLCDSLIISYGFTIWCHPLLRPLLLVCKGKSTEVDGENLRGWIDTFARFSPTEHADSPSQRTSPFRLNRRNVEFHTDKARRNKEMWLKFEKKRIYNGRRATKLLKKEQGRGGDKPESLEDLEPEVVRLLKILGFKEPKRKWLGYKIPRPLPGTVELLNSFTEQEVTAVRIVDNSEFKLFETLDELDELTRGTLVNLGFIYPERPYVGYTIPRPTREEKEKYARSIMNCGLPRPSEEVPKKKRNLKLVLRVWRGVFPEGALVTNFRPDQLTGDVPVEEVRVRPIQHCSLPLLNDRFGMAEIADVLRELRLASNATEESSSVDELPVEPHHDPLSHLEFFNNLDFPPTLYSEQLRAVSLSFTSAHFKRVESCGLVLLYYRTGEEKEMKREAQRSEANLLDYLREAGNLYFALWREDKNRRDQVSRFYSNLLNLLLEQIALILSLVEDKRENIFIKVAIIDREKEDLKWDNREFKLPPVKEKLDELKNKKVEVYKKNKKVEVYKKRDNAVTTKKTAQTINNTEYVEQLKKVREEKKREWENTTLANASKSPVKPQKLIVQSLDQLVIFELDKLISENSQEWVVTGLLLVKKAISIFMRARDELQTISELEQIEKIRLSIINRRLSYTTFVNAYKCQNKEGVLTGIRNILSDLKEQCE